MSGGWNPVTGRDGQGGRPNFAPYGAPVPAQGQAYIPHTGGPSFGLPPVPYFNHWAGMAQGMYAIGTQAVSAMNPFASPPAPGWSHTPLQGPAGGFYTHQSYANQPNGTGNILPRQPQAYPNIDSTMPAAQMTNSSGGVGCEPGYNYFFPAEHTKVHVFKTNIAPWQLPASAQIPFLAAHISSKTTMAELLKGFGCNNLNPKKNRCYEITSGGGGKWYKGLQVNGGDKKMMAEDIKNVGWDATRSGHPGERPVVCLWFCRD